MRFAVEHTTSYRYVDQVSVCHNLAHLLPRDTDHQRCLKSEVSVVPVPTRIRVRRDYFGNRVSQFSIQRHHDALDVIATSEVDVRDRAEPELDLGMTCAEARARLAEAPDEELLLAREFCLNSPLIARGPWLADYARASFPDDRSLLASARELTGRIFREFTYEPNFTTISTPLHEVIEHRKGVCQDFAHLAIGCLRSLGFAARYVSGYIETGSTTDAGEGGLVGADASHAWLSVLVPGEGWFDFDPTNDQMISEQHITVAWGRDFADVTPIRGIVFGGGSEQELTVAVSVKRLD